MSSTPRDQYLAVCAELQQCKKDLAAARALLLEIRDDKDLLRHHDCMPCPGNCDACIMQMRIDALAGKDAT
jgi:hypothetical protein